MPTHHSKVGGSVVHRIIACPWSLANVERGIPQQTSDAAAEGTALHSLLEMYYTERVATLDEVLNKKIEGVEITEERLELAKDAGRALDEYMDRLEEEIGMPCEVEFERTVHFGDHIPDAWGTCDIILRCGSVLGVLDYKFGRVHVNVKDNSQLKFYAQAARYSDPKYKECLTVEMSIIQPRSENTLTTAVVLPEELDAFETELLIALKEAEGPNPRCITGSHCRFCSLEAVCPEKTGLADAALAASIEDFDLDKLVYWMERKDELDSFLTAVRTGVLNLLEAGRRVPGFKLVARRANRKWKSERQVVDYFKAHGLEFEQYMDMKLRSPAQMEKELDELPDEFVVKKSSGVTVASEADKRVDLNEQNYSALKRFQK